MEGDTKVKSEGHKKWEDIISDHLQDDPPLAWGQGPLNSPVVVVGINPNLDDPDWHLCLRSNHKVDLERCIERTQLWVKFLLHRCEEKDLIEKLFKPEWVTNNAVNYRGFKNVKKARDFMGISLKTLFLKCLGKEADETDIKTMILAMFYTNAVRIGSRNTNELSDEDWSRGRKPNWLAKEIEIVNPRVVLCLGKDNYWNRGEYFGELTRVIGRDDELPQLHEDESGRSIIFVYHYAAYGKFLKDDHVENFGKIARRVDLFQALKRYIDDPNAIQV